MLWETGDNKTLSTSVSDVSLFSVTSIEMDILILITLSLLDSVGGA